MRLLSEKLQKFYQNDKKLSQFTKSWSGYIFILTIILALLYFIIPFLNNHLLNFEYLSNSEASLILFILSSYILLNFIASFYGNVLNGMQLMFYRNFIEVCFGITLQAGILILIFNSFDVKYITIFLLLIY